MRFSLSLRTRPLGPARCNTDAIPLQHRAQRKQALRAANTAAVVAARAQRKQSLVAARCNTAVRKQSLVTTLKAPVAAVAATHTSTSTQRRNCIVCGVTSV